MKSKLKTSLITLVCLTASLTNSYAANSGSLTEPAILKKPVIGSAALESLANPTSLSSEQLEVNIRDHKKYLELFGHYSDDKHRCPTPKTKKRESLVYSAQQEFDKREAAKAKREQEEMDKRAAAQTVSTEDLKNAAEAEAKQLEDMGKNAIRKAGQIITADDPVKAAKKEVKKGIREGFESLIHYFFN